MCYILSVSLNKDSITITIIIIIINIIIIIIIINFLIISQQFKTGSSLILAHLSLSLSLHSDCTDALKDSLEAALRHSREQAQKT